MGRQAHVPPQYHRGHRGVWQSRCWQDSGLSKPTRAELQLLDLSCQALPPGDPPYASRSWAVGQAQSTILPSKVSGPHLQPMQPGSLAEDGNNHPAACCTCSLRSLSRAWCPLETLRRSHILRWQRAGPQHVVARTGTAHLQGTSLLGHRYRC